MVGQEAGGSILSSPFSQDFLIAISYSNFNFISASLLNHFFLLHTLHLINCQALVVFTSSTALRPHTLDTLSLPFVKENLIHVPSHIPLSSSIFYTATAVIVNIKPSVTPHPNHFKSHSVKLSLAIARAGPHALRTCRLYNFTSLPTLPSHHLLQPHWALGSSSIPPSTLLPQGLGPCSFLLKSLFLKYSQVSLLTSSNVIL